MSGLKRSYLKDTNLLKDRCWIGGHWVDANDGVSSAVLDPATGDEIGRVPFMGASEAMTAVSAAETALPGWRARSAQERARILRAFFNLIVEHQDRLAHILTLEQGKPLVEARGEILYAASFIEWFAEEGKRAYGEVIPSNLAGRRLLTLRQPIGVVAAITPWNFPAAMITRKIGPALAAGCTVVLKPAPDTPLSALALAALAEKAGIPGGVLNIVTGDAAAIGAVLTGSSVVRKLSFTGSTEIGRLLLGQCAPTVKRVSLELGGNAPFIVFDDADLDAAVDGAITAKYRNAGQTCVCANRIFVQASVHDAFVARLTAASRELVVGHGVDAGTDIGPLINETAVGKVEALLDEAVAAGAHVECGGTRIPGAGHYFAPTVITGVTTAMRIAHAEIFGPVATIVRFEREEEVIAWANQGETGLAGYFFSQNIGRIWRVAEALECGMVGINTGLLSTEVAPFGGIKQSGLGREGARQGLDDYLETKYLCMAI